MIKEAIIKKKKRFSVIWMLPVFALITASWMIYKTELNRGPLIVIEFENAQGLQANKTKLKCRSVDVGIVEEVELNPEFSRAIAKVRVTKNFEDLLKADSKVWIVKPRIGNRGITGMGTILSGAYIEFSPGSSAELNREFVGLKEPPIVQKEEGGLVVELLSDDASSLNPGDPVIFRGFTIGTILDTEFRSSERHFVYRVYIEPSYSNLLCQSSRFWNSSGIRVNYGVDGLEIDTATLETIISGGVSFDLPEGVKPGMPCVKGHQFKLYKSYDEIMEQPYNHFAEYVLLFDSSIAGLKKGAPVEYRGFQIGSVVEVAPFDPQHELSGNLGPLPMPIVIRIDPGRFDFDDSPEAVLKVQQQMGTRVELGLRAMMGTRNLLAGSRFIAFDYIENAEPAKIGEYRNSETIPTVSSGFDHIEELFAQLLEKLNGLEIEETLVDIREFTDNFDTTLLNIDHFLTTDELHQLPGQLTATLQQLEQTLSGVDPSSRIYQQLQQLLEEIRNTSRLFSDYAEKLNAKPNALIFSGSSHSDPIPPKDE